MVLADVAVSAAVLFGLLLLGIPVALAIAAAGIVGLMLMDVPLLTLARQMISGPNSFPMLAVPLFLLMGGLMNAGGISQRLIDLAQSLVGRFAGGLGAVNIVTSMINAAMSGSALADTAMVGSILIPPMIREGYDRGYTAAVTGASSVVGPTFPPSIPLVVYGATFGVSIGELFLGGVIPGLLVGAGLLVGNYLYARRHGIGGAAPVSWKQFWSVFRRAGWALMTPFIILGGILGGFVTPTESAAIGVVYALLIGALIYRELTWREFKKIVFDAALSTAILLFIIAGAAAYGWFLARSEIGAAVISLFDPIRDSPVLVLAVLNLVLLVFGALMETYAIMFLLVPLLLPLVTSLGVDPVHLGIIVVLNLNIGLVTPPFGMCMFIANDLAGSSMREFRRGMFYLAPFLLLVLLLVTYVPGLSLWLPTLLMR